MLSLVALRGIVSHDPQAQTVTVLAGTPLGELSTELERRGLALSGLGGHALQTVGGALSSGVHGSSLGQPRLSETVTELRLVDGLGCSHTLTPEHPHFAAAALSLGALGVLTTVTLRVQPTYRLHVETRPLAWGEALALGPEYAQGSPFAALTWRPYRDDSEAVLLRRAWPTEEPVTGAGSGLMDGAERALSEAGAALSPVPKPLRQVLERRAQEPQVLGASVALLAAAEPLRELEYAVPLAALPATLRDLRAALQRVAAASQVLELPLEIRFVAPDSLLLGTPEGEGHAAISLAAPLDLPPATSAPYFREAEAVLRAHGGLPQWGKLHALGETELAALYPGWADFRAAREHFDPERRFGSPYLRRILGE